MWKFLSIFLLSALLSVFVPASAHPLDISSTTMTVNGTRVVGTTYLHPAEVERILGLRGIMMRSITYGDYYTHQDYIFEYLSDKIRVESSDNICKLGDFATERKWVDEIFSAGFPVSYTFSCDKPIVNSLNVTIGIFVDLPLQTNRITLYDAQGKSLGYKVLTSSIHSYVFDLSGAQVQAIDSDHDGLSDEEERAYRTDPHNPDTDGDNYSDGEEVNNGWNPLSGDPSPGQKYREKPLPVIDTGSIDRAQDELSRRYMPQTGLLDASGYGAGYLKQSLSRMVAFFDKPDSWSFASLFFLVVFLGFIHAAGPGHSKSLLAAFVLSRERRFRDGVLFALIFTVTHLADIALLVLVTKYLFSVYDPTPYMTVLQRTGAGLLVCVAIFLVIRSVIRMRKFSVTREDDAIQEKISPIYLNQSEVSDMSEVRLPRSARNDEDKNVLSGSNLLIGFLAGLAPCTFGWSIFLVLFSLGKMQWALPLLGALGIGIFLCLLLVLVLTFIFRERILARAPGFARYSEIFSAISIGMVAVIVGIAVL